ncbi:MAG: hypothetical protein E3J71_06940 [Candidatus Stahlbacteria bacterium]|nr:MAG: hypothetical protein E3J71_06940 [Candidatus Stahlbacteria bacterium]
MPRVKKKLPWWVSFMRYFGRGVVIVWAAFWLFFIWASVLTELSAGSESLGGVWVLVGGTLILLAGAIIPWIWEGVGAFVLLGEAAAFFVFFMIISQGRMGAVVLLVFCLPPLVGGGLSLASWLVARKAPPKQA